MAKEEDVSNGSGTKSGTNAIPAVSSGPNVILVIIVLVVIQALVVTAIWFFAFRLPKEKEKQLLANELKEPSDTVQEEVVVQTISIAPGEMILLKEAEITVNVSGTNGERFLQAWISVAYDSGDKENKDILTKMPNYESQMKSKAEEYLAGLTMEDINSKGIRQRICRDLKIELNGIVPKGAGKLSNVYLEKFIIQ